MDLAWVLAQDGLTIDWENLPTYNTIMSVAAGAGLVLIVRLGREVLADSRRVSVEGYAMAFGVLGFILTATGLHMTLTWPLAPAFPFDNIIFGETSLAFGVLLLALSFYGWRRGHELLAVDDALDRIAAVARHQDLFVLGMGLGLFGIAAAGMTYQLFIAPPAEPITGFIANLNVWIEPTFISALYATVGVGAVSFPLAVRGSRTAMKVAGWTWAVSGWIFLLFGSFNFFTHIGLIVNTM